MILVDASRAGHPLARRRARRLHDPAHRGAPRPASTAALSALAYTLGQIKVEGSLGVAMKLASLIEAEQDWYFLSSPRI